MNKATIYRLTAVLSLALILCFGGCDNPANDDADDNDTAAALEREAADNFYAAHQGILEMPEDMLTLDDGEPVALALEAYRGLKAAARALLAPEKARLEVLKAGVDRLKAWAEHGVYYAAADMAAYLAAQPENTPEEPCPVAYSGSETMITLYNALAAARRYVDLDLSDTSVGGITAGNEEGRAFIVSLVLPDSLAEIPDGTNTARIFQGFSNLKTLSAAGVARVGEYTFTALTSLVSVNLPRATDIGNYAFRDCVNLATASLPKAETIGSSAFRNCSSLDASFPEAKTIGDYAFQDTLGASAPNAETIGAYAFAGRSKRIIMMSLSAVSTIGNFAFQGNTIERIVLPNVVSIGSYAFEDCATLTTIRIPKAETVGSNAFRGCTALASITLGAMPPAIQTTARIFTGIATNPGKTITITAPQLTLYTAPTAPLRDKVNQANSDAGYFWDNNTDTRDNLTVNLVAQ